jgi:hypothetical protein
VEVAVVIITVRDGKELDVDQCLAFTRDAIDGWAKRNHTMDNPTGGMALALEAALVRVMELEHDLDREKERRRRRWWLE